MQVTPTEAIKLYDVSKPTLYDDMKKGKLSFVENGRRKKRINIAELDRVYQKRKPPEDKDHSADVKERKDITNLDVNQVALLKEKVNFLEARLEASEKEKDRWQKAFDKIQDTDSKITLLLEDHRRSKNTEKPNEWEKSFKALEERIANQEKSAQEEKQKVLDQNIKLRNALKAEKNKSFFQKLFG